MHAHTPLVMLLMPVTMCCLVLLHLQAGHWDSEGQQRLVSLTAQVTAQAAQLAAAEQRCKELLVSRGKLRWRLLFVILNFEFSDQLEIKGGRPCS